MKSWKQKIAPYQQRINRIFAVAMLIPASFLFLYSVSSGTHNAIESKLFKWNNKTTTVEAKVHGWGFRAHRSKRSGSSFSYDYGVEYSFNKHKYFATVNIVSNTNDKNGEQYYKPLPTHLSLLIKTEKPQQYLYEYKKKTNNIVLSLLFGAIVLACIYCIVRPKTSFYFKTTQKNISPVINNFILNLLVFVPFVFCYIIITETLDGSEATPIDGYEIISKRTPFATEIYTNVTTYKGRTVDFVSMEIDKKYLQENDVVEAYFNINKDVVLPTKKINSPSSIRLFIYDTQKTGYFYLYTPKQKYMVMPQLYH